MQFHGAGPDEIKATTFHRAGPDEIIVEVLISGIDELLLHQNYFIYNITHYGMEIYSMEKEKIKAAMLKDIKARYKPDALLSEEDAKDVLDLAERVIETLSKRIDD